MIRVFDDAIAAAETVATACPTEYIQRSVRSLVVATEGLKKDYGWRPPRVPRTQAPDNQLSLLI